ncbi:MAG: sigma-70 family RNA polymerase sigma factor [Acidobacteriota bacterium]
MAEEITQLLVEWGQGDATALDRLMPLVYDELRRLARHHLQQQGAHRTLQPTAVVNEAYLRLVKQQQIEFENRAQFYGLAAKLIRDLLVDDTRRRLAEKRGGAGLRVSLTEADKPGQPEEFDLLALDEALHKLARNKPQHSRVVELRFFGGLTIAEAAEVLGISHATVERDWSFARAWLYAELET